MSVSAPHPIRLAGAVLATVAGLGLLLSVGACAPQLNRIELAVQENQDELAEMRAENRRLQQELTALQKLLRMESESGDQSAAQRYAQLGQVSMQLDQLMHKLDDNAAYMRELSARVDLLATRSGIPTLGEYKPPEPQTEAVAALPEEGRSIFQAAQLDRSRGNVELAREGFSEFLQRYPGSELADDARYWLGDLAYGEGDWQQANAEFEQLLADYPDTPRAPAALLKRGYCLRDLGREDEAKAAFRRLIAEHPDSNEAALIRDQVD